MNTTWLTIKLWFHNSRWALLAALGVIVGILGFLLRGLFMRKQPAPDPERPSRLPPPPAILQAAADKAKEDALVVRTQQDAKTGADNEELKNIMAIQDGAARRKALADKLRRS